MTKLGLISQQSINHSVNEGYTNQVINQSVHQLIDLSVITQSVKHIIYLLCSQSVEAAYPTYNVQIEARELRTSRKEKGTISQLIHSEKLMCYF